MRGRDSDYFWEERRGTVIRRRIWERVGDWYTLFLAVSSSYMGVF